MFGGGFSGLSSMMELMKGMGGSSKRIAALTEEMASRLAGRRVVGKAGGGMVTVTFSGTKECLAVHVDPIAIEKGQTLVQDLTRTALNDAMKQLAAAEAEEQMRMAKAMMKELPSMLGELASMMGGSAGGSKGPAAPPKGQLR